MKQLFLIAALCLAACGTEADPPTDQQQQSIDPTFTNVYDGVLKQGCSCHLSADGAGGLAMADQASAYAALVAQAASTGGPCDGETRVISGDADQSVLYRKITGTDLCGSQMPLGGAAMSEGDLDLLRRWIEAGAAND